MSINDIKNYLENKNIAFYGSLYITYVDCVHNKTEVVNDHLKEWQCSHCHTVHDRDVNAARNIKNG